MVGKVLQKSKIVDEEKVGVSFQMPKSLKQEVDKVCEEHGIKLTTFFNSLAQVAIDELKGKGDLVWLEGRRLASKEVANLEERIKFGPSDAEEYHRLVSEVSRLKEIYDL